jgi:peptidyl-prolyl cis-trans isomerase C
VTVQVRPAVPYKDSPDSKESGLFYAQKIMLKGFYMAATAHALHILVKHKEIAEDIIKQLGKGAKFQTLAKKHSSCPSGKKGGDLGEFKRGQMVPQFDKIAFKGAILEPHLVKTKFGWHVIKVLYRT